MTRLRFQVAGAISIVLVGACAATPIPPGPTSSTQGASSPSVAPDEADDGWQLIGIGSKAENTQISAVAAADRGFVAMGSSGGAGEIAMAWSTRDGRTWTAEEVPSRGTSPRTLLPWNDRFLAFGGGSSNRCAHPGEMDTWVRRPDTTWLEAPHDQAFCGGNALTPLLQDTHAWIIGNGFGEVPTALDSPDGLTWTNRSAPLGNVQIMAAAADQDGLWISDRAFDTGRPEVRNSPDGRRWTAVKLPEIRLSDAPGIVTLPSGIALVAETERGPMLVVRQDRAWVTEPIQGLDGLSLGGVRPAGDGLVAIATREDGSSVVVGSVDGATWWSVRTPTEAGATPILWDVAIGHGLVVLVGQVPGTASDELAAGGMWIAPESILER